MSKQENTCYVDRCIKPGITDEHAPARAFFPERKDVGIHYREHQVTVRACETHNSDLSKDDQYVAFTMQTNYRTNRAAMKNFDTKILRSIDRDKKLMSVLYRDMRQVWLKNPATGKLKRTGIFNVERSRISSVMCRIAAALYYKTQNRRVSIDPSDYVIYSPDTLSPIDLKPDYPQELEAYIASRSGFEPLSLWHPDIFCCDYVVDPADPSRFVFRFTFYGNFRYRVIH